MESIQVIESVRAEVKNTLKDTEKGHDWWHIKRVVTNAKNIWKVEQAGDWFIIEAAALLHDIADPKFNHNDDRVGPQTTSAILHKLNIDQEKLDHIVNIVANVSFKGGNIPSNFDSLEFRIVQDADRLDALGAIGISRAFHYGGYKNRVLYDPSIIPKIGMTPEEYRKHEGTTINHFYEKLLVLKDNMHTKTGRKLAEERHRFMESFLKQFYAEWG